MGVPYIDTLCEPRLCSRQHAALEVQIKHVAAHPQTKSACVPGLREAAVPDADPRRFYRLAGLLEVADEEGLARIRRLSQGYTTTLPSALPTVPRRRLLEAQGAGGSSRRARRSGRLIWRLAQALGVPLLDHRPDREQPQRLAGILDLSECARWASFKELAALWSARWCRFPRRSARSCAEYLELHGRRTPRPPHASACALSPASGRSRLRSRHRGPAAGGTRRQRHFQPGARDPHHLRCSCPVTSYSVRCGGARCLRCPAHPSAAPRSASLVRASCATSPPRHATTRSPSSRASSQVVRVANTTVACWASQDAQQLLAHLGSGAGVEGRGAGSSGEQRPRTRRPERGQGDALALPAGEPGE